MFWIELPAEGDVLIYLVEPKGERALVRRIARSDEGTEATIEMAGLVVRSVATALVSGNEIGMKPVETRPEPPPEPTPEPEPEPPPKPDPDPDPGPEPPSDPSGIERLAIALDYRGGSFATEIPWQNGAGLRFSARPLRRLVVGADYHFLVAQTADGDDVRFRLQRNPVAAFAALRLGERAVQSDFGVELGIDPMRRRTLDASNLDATEPAILWQGFAGAWGRLRFGGWRGIWLFAGLGLEVPFNRFEFVVREPERRVLVSPHAVRGRASAGIEFAFLPR